MEKHILALESAGAPSNLDDDDIEDKALEMAIEEVYEANGRKWKPWAKNARSIRMGDIILLVDSDTVVPEVSCRPPRCKDNFASQSFLLFSSVPSAFFYYRIALGMLRVNLPKVPMLLSFNTNQVSFILLLICSFFFGLTVFLNLFISDVMQVAHHFFENGIAHFTRRINKCISLGCANGEVAPFVGHNAFLRWSAIQDAAFIDPVDQVKKIWSESNVSEDFDMALRLQVRSKVINFHS